MKTLIPLLALCLAVSSAEAQTPKRKPGQAQTPPAQLPPPTYELRPKVEALLSGYEFEPRKDDWERLGPGALDVLVAIANDEKALPSRRQRAIASMNHFDDASVSVKLASFADSTTLEPRLRATAAQVLLQRDGEKALPKVAPLLSSPDPLIRENAAKSIAKVGTPNARKTLESRLEKEQDAAVREAIQQGLSSPR